MNDVRNPPEESYSSSVDDRLHGNTKARPIAKNDSIYYGNEGTISRWW